MKIKKVDDKPMVLHTKNEADKSQFPNSDDGSNNDRQDGRTNGVRSMGKGNPGGAVASLTGKSAVRTALDPLDGGNEMRQASYAAYEAARPITGIASRGSDLFRPKAIQERKRRIKQVQTSSNAKRGALHKSDLSETEHHFKQVSMPAAKDFIKKGGIPIKRTSPKAMTRAMANKTSTLPAKFSQPLPANPSAQEVSMATGRDVGKSNSFTKQSNDRQITNQTMKQKYLINKRIARTKKKSSVIKQTGNSFRKGIAAFAKAVKPILGVAALPTMVFMIAIMPVVAVVALLYNSPYALFLPPLEEGETVQSVAGTYVAGFQHEVETLAEEHAGCDRGEIVYVDYEGSSEPSNYYDILCVYMVKYVFPKLLE